MLPLVYMNKDEEEYLSKLFPVQFISLVKNLRSKLSSTKIKMNRFKNITRNSSVLLLS